MPKLKVFCATSGFYDNVVAAPSKPAALKAWGAKTDLFSMGVARLVTDPAIRQKALERPGEIIRLSRSGGVEIERPKRRPRSSAAQPNRTRILAAEKALATLEQKQAEERDKIDAQLDDLRKKRDVLESRHTKERQVAEGKVERARETYEAALAKWSPS